MRGGILTCVAIIAISSAALANDWKKFYTPIPGPPNAIPSTEAAEALPTSGDLTTDVRQMYARGFTPIGFTSFNSTNDQTKDALKLANELHARYVIIHTNFAGQQTGVLPLTTPNTTTSTVNGSYGSTPFNATATSTGSRTTLIPFAINHYDKTALFFTPVAHWGSGMLTRGPNDAEVRQYESRHISVVIAVRDGSPADVAGILPDDILTTFNGEPFQADKWAAMLSTPLTDPIKIVLVRHGQSREVSMSIPEDWRKPS